jgi:hypothetical protein
MVIHSLTSGGSVLWYLSFLLITNNLLAYFPAQHNIPGNEIENTFPAYNVVDFGAIGDSSTLNSRPIQDAIDAAAGLGGGTVFFPPGEYLTGTIRMRDNITLYLENGCTLLGSSNMEDYDPEQKHLLYAEDAENMVISGHGSINGNGPSFWDDGRLEKWLKGEIDLPRTADMIRFDRCSNIVIEDVGIDYGAFWNIGFGDCSRISIHSISMRNGIYEEDGPNTDGINLWHCTRVQISDCDIITGDDCIVVLGKSRDVTITNCKLQTSETAIMISGVRNLAISNITIHDSGCGIGFRVWNGIEVDGVVINNLVMDVSDRFKGGGTALYMWSFPLYVETSIPEETPLPPPGTIKNVNISNMVASSNGLACINGAKNGYIKGLTLNNVKFFMYGGKTSAMNDNPPYPYPIYGFHHASPYSLFFRHVDGLKLVNVRLEWNTPEKPEWGSALRCWKVNNLEINGFVGRQSLRSVKPAIGLQEVQGAHINNCIAPEGTGTFIEMDEQTSGVTLMGNDLSRCKEIYPGRPGMQKSTMFESCNRLPGE